MGSRPSTVVGRFYYTLDDAAFYQAYDHDRDAVAKGAGAKELAQRPLWPGGMPSELEPQWQDLRGALLSRDEDWQVWTNWYEARLRGDVLHEDLEIARITELSEGDWARGKDEPGHVNAKIRAIIEQFTPDIPMPAQDPLAETFGMGADGRITLTTQEAGSHLTDTPDQRILYEELRIAAKDLLSQGPNHLGPVATALRRLIEALPDNMDEARIARLWPRANRLRIFLKHHELARENEEYAHLRLAPDIAEEAEHITGVFNNLAFGDPGLRTAEEAALGPQEDQQLEKTDALAHKIRG